MKITNLLAVAAVLAWTAAVTSPVWAAAGDGRGERAWNGQNGGVRDGAVTNRRGTTETPRTPAVTVTPPRAPTVTTDYRYDRRPVFVERARDERYDDRRFDRRHRWW